MQSQNNQTIEGAFANLSLNPAPPSTQPLEETFAAMTISPPPDPFRVCPRLVSVFTCKCKYLSQKRCTCCPDLSKPSPGSPDPRVVTAKITHFPMECPQCRFMGMEIQAELAKQHGDDLMANGADGCEEEASWAYLEYERLSQEAARFMERVARERPDRFEWQLVWISDDGHGSLIVDE